MAVLLGVPRPARREGGADHRRALGGSRAPLTPTYEVPLWSGSVGTQEPCGLPESGECRGHGGPRRPPP